MQSQTIKSISFGTIEDQPGTQMLHKRKSKTVI